MKRKTDAQKNIIRREGMRPIFWQVLSDVPHCMIVKHRLTGTVRMIAK